MSSFLVSSCHFLVYTFLSFGRDRIWSLFEIVATQKNSTYNKCLCMSSRRQTTNSHHMRPNNSRCCTLGGVLRECYTLCHPLPPQTNWISYFCFEFNSPSFFSSKTFRRASFLCTIFFKSKTSRMNPIIPLPTSGKGHKENSQHHPTMYHLSQYVTYPRP